MPNVLALWNRLDAKAKDVPEILRARVLEHAEANSKELAADTAWIAETIGRPWDFVAHDRGPEEQIRAAALENPPEDDDSAFDDWWEQVSSRENVTGNFRYLPDAWDGAQNFLQSAGQYQRFFDLGPLSVIYSRIGLAEDNQ